MVYITRGQEVLFTMATLDREVLIFTLLVTMAAGVGGSLLSVGSAAGVAASVDEVIRDYPHWLADEAQEREVRKAFYGALLKAGVDAVVDVVNNVFKNLRGPR